MKQEEDPVKIQTPIEAGDRIWPNNILRDGKNISEEGDGRSRQERKEKKEKNFSINFYFDILYS